MEDEEYFLAIQNHYLQLPHHPLSLPMMNQGSCFKLENSDICTNIENITFGPKEHRVRIAQNENNKVRVVYYCLLSYIFQQERNPTVMKVHERLVRYIATHNMSLYTIKTFISDEEAKSCLIKFLFSLSQRRGVQNYLLKQFQRVPEMDLLMINLIQAISGFKDVTVDFNCCQYQRKLQEELGLDL